MRCASCNADTPGKTLKGNGYRCPACGHQFVANKKTDGLSDLNIKQAIEQVSERGTVHYLPDHLAYQLHRRLVPRRRAARVLRVVFAVLLALIGAALLFARAWGWAILAFVLAALLFRSRKTVVGTDAFSLVKRFETVNPPKHRVPATPDLIERERGRDKMLAALRGAGRLLLCQHRRDAEFFIANDFHLQHACPVAGPDGRALDGYPELETRLSRPGALDLFVLHDFTPGGAAYLRRVRAVPELSRRRDPATVIEMGFDQRHRPLLENALFPLDRIPSAMDERPGAGWTDKLGAQVAALRPALMLAAAGKSIEERAPIHVPQDESDGHEGDSDRGDSE